MRKSLLAAGCIVVLIAVVLVAGEAFAAPDAEEQITSVIKNFLENVVLWFFREIFCMIGDFLPDYFGLSCPGSGK